MVNMFMHQSYQLYLYVCLFVCPLSHSCKTDNISSKLLHQHYLAVIWHCFFTLVTSLFDKYMMTLSLRCQIYDD